MLFGKVGINPLAFEGWTKTKFKKHFKGKERYFLPFTLDEVWKELKQK